MKQFKVFGASSWSGSFEFDGAHVLHRHGANMSNEGAPEILVAHGPL